MLGDGEEVAPVERARKAFAIENRIGSEVCRDAPVGIDVGEIEFAARFQQAVGLAEDFRLVGAQIDDAVGDDEVEAAGLKVQLAKLFEIAFQA